MKYLNYFKTGSKKVTCHDISSSNPFESKTVLYCTIRIVQLRIVQLRIVQLRIVQLRIVQYQTIFDSKGLEHDIDEGLSPDRS